jgi:GNAT superfamily N-acetyltransferase
MPSDDVARIKAFELESVALVADEFTLIPEGWVAKAPSLPMVWSLNHVGVTAALPSAEVMGLADHHMNGVPYRHVVVDDEAAGERLQGDFRAAGWRIERNVLMALRRDPGREVDTSGVTVLGGDKASGIIEPAEEEALELMAEWTANEEELRAGSDAHRQVLEATRLTWRARNGRRLAVVGSDGALAGITVLFSDGIVAQVEDVYVVPGERGRGVGRALVTRAARLAVELGHELSFIIGDDEDWPQHLYAQVGFEPVARTWVFHR